MQGELQVCIVWPKRSCINGGMRYALSFWGSLTRDGEVPLGTIQMTFTNLTGVVMVLLLLPSIKFEKEKAKPYLYHGLRYVRYL